MKVIIAEDDLALSLFLRNGLELDGHIVSCASDGLTALEHIEEHAPDLLVLDLGLPRMDGVDVLRTLHEQGSAISVLVLTGRNRLAQKLECLNLGADDYLVKPFSMHELDARCRTMARRRSNAHVGLLSYGSLKMDRIARTAGFAGRMIEFTTKEFSLLEYLLLQCGRPVTRKELLDKVWHMPVDGGTNVVDVYINYLRRKLSEAGASDVIETVRGEGYAIGLAGKRPRHYSIPAPVLGGSTFAAGAA